VKLILIFLLIGRGLAALGCAKRGHGARKPRGHDMLD
jgi:alpha-beta hydrolase superfamily lysophospholipase